MILGLRRRCEASVQHSGSYGIQPGERISSVLERAGGFSADAYPRGAVLMRREVREVEMKVASRTACNGSSRKQIKP